MTETKLVKYLSKTFRCKQCGAPIPAQTIKKAIKLKNSFAHCLYCETVNEIPFPEFLPPTLYSLMEKPSEWDFRTRGRYGKGWYREVKK